MKEFEEFEALEQMEEKKARKRKKPQVNNPLKLALIVLKVSEKIPLLYSFMVFLFTFFLVIFTISYNPALLPWTILFCAISYVPVLILAWRG